MMKKLIFLALATALVACAKQATVDLFYVCSTETSDWVNEQGDTVHFADMTTPEQASRMVAAYVIGYQVTESDLQLR